MIEVDKLVKRYGPTVAVDEISFAIARGEVVGFLGPNGAGKSTTMRILTCFLPATSGAARIAGHDVFSNSLAARREIGYLPEGVPLYPELRVKEYLRYRAKIKGVPAKARKNRIAHVMDRCGVTQVARKLIGSLSKGFRQRVGLAEALVSDPPVLIFDEPTIGLDPHQIREVRQLIHDLGQDHTVLLSTHILPEVEMTCERVLIIHNGKLVFQESLSEIAKHGARGTHVIVEARVPAETENTFLNTIPGVQKVRHRAFGNVSHFDLEVAPEADPREEIFQHAVQHGWTLRELRREQPSLEDIFVRLTTGDE